MWKFVKIFFIKVLRKWWVWLPLLMWDVFKDRIHGEINNLIDLHANKIMAFIEKIFNVPTGIGGLLFFVVLIILLIKTHRETKRDKLPEDILGIRKPTIDDITTEEEPDATLIRHVNKVQEQKTSSTIAFEDEVIVKGTYKYQPRNTGSIKVWTHTTSLKELFKLISPYILDITGTSESSVKRQFATSILREKEIRDFFHEEIDEDVLQLIREKFLTLGLIRLYDGTNLEDLPMWYWSLKEKGKTLMLKERSVKKQTFLPLKIEFEDSNEFVNYEAVERNGKITRWCTYRFRLHNSSSRPIKDVKVQIENIIYEDKEGVFEFNGKIPYLLSFSDFGKKPKTLSVDEKALVDMWSFNTEAKFFQLAYVGGKDDELGVHTKVPLIMDIKITSPELKTPITCRFKFGLIITDGKVKESMSILNV